MADNDRWNLNRVGRAAVVTTIPGQVPAYGLAMDLGTGTVPYMTADQYQDFMRDIGERTATEALQSDPMYQEELQRAQNLQTLGYNMPNSAFPNADDDDEGWLERRANDVMTGINMFKSSVGTLASQVSTNADDAARLIPIVGGYVPAGTSEEEAEAATYERYKLLGGILTQDDFESFDAPTRHMLISRAGARQTGETLLAVPAVRELVEGIDTAYRAAQTPFTLFGNNARPAFAHQGFGGVIARGVDPMWFQRGEWAEAWKESQDQSLGNAMVNSLFEPYVGDERVDEWKRESSIYQLTSLGVELGAAWVADPGVIAGKTLGAAARLRRGELPLNEQSGQYKAMTQALQRERITVGGLSGRIGQYRARRMQMRWDDLEEFARTNSYSDFSALPMFQRRDIDGQAAAYALHWAFNKAPKSDVKLADLVKSAEEKGLGLNYPDFPSLTQQLLHGDPKAYRDLDALNAATPEELNKIVPGAQNFLDAIDKTKTKLPELTREIEELSKVDPKSKFHEWSLHTEIDQRVKDIAQAEDVLRKYEDYGTFLENVNRAPRISQVSAKRNFFMENQFGKTHMVLKFTRPIWIKKANTVEIHDVDSGATSIRRQFEQLDHLFGYQNPEALDHYLTRWTAATTSHERYDVVRELEETVTIDAAAQRFGVHPGVIRTIFDKMEAEQNKRLEGFRRGSDSTYSTAPSAAQRLEAGDQNIKLLRQDPETGMVELELMESGGRRTTVTVHESALQPRGARPVDPTQTPNYYQPIDHRRFYLELKRNRDLIETMHFAGVRNLKAASFETIDQIGTAFNALWKPAVLFRFGWPMRVLMDENMRALAVLGIPSFTKYYGDAYGRAMNNATAKVVEGAHNTFNALLVDPIVARMTGRKRMALGPGPVVERTKRTMDPVVREEQILNTPRVPESMTPVLDNGRYERVAGIVADWDNYDRANARFGAWKRESEKRAAGERSSFDPLDEDPSPTLLRAVEGSMEAPVPPGIHPMQVIRQSKYPFLRDGHRPAAVAYDPITGKQVTTGYAVPLQHTKISATSSEAELARWYSDNREHLASTGHRILRDQRGNLYVARVFSRQKGQKRAGARKAIEMSEFTESGGFYNLRAGTHHGVVWQDRLGQQEAQAINAEFDKAIAANGDLRRAEVLAAEGDPDMQFDLELDDLEAAKQRAILRRREVGKGVVTVRTADGETVEYPSAYEGHSGEIMRSLISSQGSMEVLSDGHGAATSLMRRQATGHRAYQPPVMTDAARTKGTAEYNKAIEYFNKWGDLLNGQIAHSPIWSKMLQGWSDEKIVNWLNKTTDGARVRREMKHEFRDTELWVNEHRAKLDYYLPNKKLQRLLGKGRVPHSRLRREIPEEDYPTVFGPDVEFLSKTEGAGHLLGWAADRIWYALGTVPIDTLSRHPFARAMYDLKMRSLVGTTDSKWLDERMLARYEMQARKFARDQVRKTLWDLIDQTNFTDALRFMSPFWGAQSEAIVKWGKIISHRPETIARAFALNNAVYQNFVTVDEEGNPVSRGRFDYTPTDRVIMRIPSAMRKTALGKALETIGTVGIPIGSANTVLQGEMPLFPGPGPMLTIPADKLMRAVSDIYGTQFDENSIYRWLFPIGRPQHGGIRGVLDQVTPGWGRRVMQFSEGDEGISYANLMTETAREMELENKRKGLPPPTPEQIEKQVRWLYGLKIVAGLVSPVQTQFRPKHQFAIDAAHKYQREYGLDWFDRFVQDFGLEMSRYAVSSSNSTVGIPPTAQGMEEWSQNKRLIQKYQHWGDAIISPEAHTDDFSSDAYYAQFDINIGPGESTPLRESQSQAERFAIADARAGWYEFRKVDATLDAELQARGLHSLQQVGAEDLALIKRNFIEDLTQRNPAWREDYNQFNNDIYSRVAELQEWAFRPEFDNRPDIQGARQYLLIRDQVTAELDRYAATTGGSRSLQAEENGALREWFYSQVGQLAQANPAFAEFYNRYLSQDTLEQGSGGF